MPSKMTYRLALDLGSTSLGWAIFLLDNSIPPKPKALVKAGVRIFPNSRESAPTGQQGESLAKTRREKRQARRRRDRLLQRKERLIRALIKWGLFPQNISERKKLELYDPYALRADGLKKQLESFEFGRALFHLNQRRGFKSNRKTDSNDKNEGPLKTAIKELREKIVGDFQTVGAWLNHRKQTMQPFPGAAVVSFP